MPMNGEFMMTFFYHISHIIWIGGSVCLCAAGIGNLNEDRKPTWLNWIMIAAGIILAERWFTWMDAHL